ncbi:hypothetical protein TNCV_3315781 [Trichonephila clavipes]|nr:hypothetical protein TNCV_3315781 [Trichonephila clavipes]
MVKTSTTPEMAPPLLTTTPHQREDVSTHLTCIAALHCGSLLILGLNKASHDPIPIPLGYRDHVYMLIRYQTDKRARRGLLVTDHGQVTSTTPEMAPSPNYHTTPTGGRFDTFNVHRCPTLWVFIDTRLEQGKPRSDTYTTRLPRPCIHVDSLPNRQTCKALGVQRQLGFT